MFSLCLGFSLYSFIYFFFIFNIFLIAFYGLLAFTFYYFSIIILRFLFWFFFFLINFRIFQQYFDSADFSQSVEILTDLPVFTTRINSIFLQFLTKMVFFNFDFTYVFPYIRLIINIFFFYRFVLRFWGLWTAFFLVIALFSGSGVVIFILIFDDSGFLVVF